MNPGELNIKKIGYKLMIIGLLLVIPMVTLVYLYVGQINKELKQVSKEVDLIAHARQLIDIDLAFVQQSFLSRALINGTQLNDVIKDDWVASNLDWAPEDIASAWQQVIDLDGDSEQTRDASALEIEEIYIKSEDVLAKIKRQSRLLAMLPDDIQSIVTQAYYLLPELSVDILVFNERLLAHLKGQNNSELYGVRYTAEAERIVQKFNRITQSNPDIQREIDAWKKGVDLATEKKKMLSFAGLLGEQGDYNTFDSEMVELSTRVLGIVKYNVDIQRDNLKKIEAVLNYRYGVLLSKKTYTMIVIMVLVVLSFLLGFYILQNIKLSKKYFDSQKEIFENEIRARTADIVEEKKHSDEINRLLQEEKNRAQELAVQANNASEAKSNFLASMSHEIRTPLNSIIGGTKMLHKTSLTPSQSNTLNMIASSGKTLLSLINDILDFSKIEAGQLKLESIEFDLESVVIDLANMFRFRAAEKGIQFYLCFSTDCEGVWCGDVTRIKQILINLVGNAIKFTEHGYVSLSVAFSDDKKLVFSIEDTGVGIPSDSLDRLFEEFVQSDTSITRRFGGTGLGLSITKNLTDLMGGDIDVSSQVNIGTLFTVSIALTQVRHQVAPLEVNVGTVVESEMIQRRLTAMHLGQKIPIRTILMNGKMADSLHEYDCFIVEAAIFERFKAHGQDQLFHEVPTLFVGENAQCDIAGTCDRGIPYASIYQRAEDIRRFITALSQGRSTSELLTQDGMVKHGDMGVDGEQMHYDGAVLVVEDVKFNQVIILDALDDRDVSADCVDNGKLAVEQVREKDYRLVFMDLHMPEMDGYAATKAIRKFENDNGLPPIKIVAMTADVVAGTREKVLACGMDDYICKPFEEEDLDTILERYLVS